MTKQDENRTPFDERDMEVRDAQTPAAKAPVAAPGTSENEGLVQRVLLWLAAMRREVRSVPRATQLGFTAAACAVLFVLLSAFGGHLASRVASRPIAGSAASFSNPAQVGAPRFVAPDAGARTAASSGEAANDSSSDGVSGTAQNGAGIASVVDSSAPVIEAQDNDYEQTPARREEQRIAAEMQLLEDKKRAIERQLEDKQLEEKRRLEDKAIDEQRDANNKKRTDEWRAEDREQIAERRRAEQARAEEEKRLEAEGRQPEEDRLAEAR